MSSGRAHRQRRRWGIGQVLVGLVLVTLAPFIVLEIYRGAQDVAHRRESIVQRATAQSREEAETMDDFLRFSERFLATLAGAPSVQAMDGPGAEALFEAARNQNPNYENIFLLDVDGTQRASTVPAVSDPQAAERGYFRQALETERIALSDVLVLPESGRSVVVLAYPVIVHSGARVGVVAIALNIARISGVIGYVGLPAGSVVLVVEENGTVIGSSDEPDTWVGRSLAGLKVYEETRTHPSGDVSGPMSDGVDRVVGYQSLKRAPWVLMAGIPQAEVDAEFRVALLRVVEQIVLAGVAAALLAWIVLRRVVLPIRILSDGARAFAAGFLNRRIPLRRDDELGDLADALNSMAAALERRLEEEAAHAQALRDLNDLQTEFVATASHELRTPVTAIRTYAEALMRPDIVDEETRRECLEGIDRSSARLAALVRTLLDVSRIDSGRVVISLGPVDVAAVARAAVAQAAPGPDERVIVAIPAGLPPALADADRLEDVLANLIGNARKFSPPGAPVTVAVRPADSEIEILVEDRGAGIPAEELPRIFDRFYQVQRGAGRTAGGSGLGLYIARGYVTAMGGRIRVESTPGEGSRFYVALPLAVAEPPDKGDAEHAGIAGAARGG